ncbi:MAG: MerR family transcriptional regulator [Pseudorhodoplanes sp.]|nr:MerR family transcriptional regulator [Pseudorhodoplanes sp.]
MDKAPDAFRTISEVAEDLAVPQHVLRFWESRFTQIKPMKRAGGRRYYRPDDVDLLRGIHHLLYGEGYTIRGVQRILKEQGVKFVEQVWRPGAEQPAHFAADDDEAPPRRRLVAQSSRSHGDVGAERDDDEERFAAAPPRPRASPEAARETLRKLQAALFELGECRRLLDEAMGIAEPR